MGRVRRDSVDTREKSRLPRVPETAMTISGVKREGQKGGRKEQPACHTRTRTIAEIPQARASRVTTMPSWKSAFKIPDLPAWMRAHHLRLLSAALTVLSAYCKAGRPAQRLKPWGSYEGWS